MAVQHINSLLTSLNLPEEISKACKASINSVNSAFIIRLTTNSISFPERRQRFKPAPAAEEPPPAAPKAKIDKKTRDENFEELKKKTEESKDFTKKLIEDRIERQKRNQEREREFRMKTMQEMEEQRKQQEEILKKLEDEKLSKLNDLAKKGEQRKKILEEKKEEITKSPVNTKPLYKQMEDAYKQKVLMPQLEHHKAELAKKRINYQPLNPDELKEHSRNHEELKRQFEYRRKKELEQKQLDSQLNMASNSMQSKFTVAVLEEERRKKEEKERKEYEKKLNVNKRLQYSRLVKEMFVPVAGEGRVPEAVATISKSKVRSAENDRNSEKKKIGVTDYKSDIGLRPTRNRTKEPEVKKEAEVVDYLALKRKERENKPSLFKALHVELQKDIEDDEMDSGKMQIIRAKAEKIDKQAKQREGLIGKMGKDGVKGIKAGDEVNDMIISSIRAKLALLGKFQSK